MPKEKLDLIVEGGKATTTPQLAQKLGPLKINISEVMKKINDKTSSFSGIKVPGTFSGFVYPSLTQGAEEV